jgi:GIY-YIG catalytic domain
MFHVYVIVSESHPERFYIGFSSRPDERLIEHNARKNSSITDFTSLAFRRNVQFFLRRTSSSIRALRKRGLWPSFSSSTRSRETISVCKYRFHRLVK